MTSFDTTYGFDKSDLGLHNWRERPYNTWSFQHVDKMVPTTRVAAGGVPGPERPCTQTGLSKQPVRFAGATVTLEDFLATTQADSFRRVASRFNRFRLACAAHRPR